MLYMYIVYILYSVNVRIRIKVHRAVGFNVLKCYILMLYLHGTCVLQVFEDDRIVDGS